MSRKKYIITGPPGSGKSTLIKALQAHGIPCINEVSRDVIIKEQEQEGDGMPWKNINRFTQLVFRETIFRLSNYPKSLFTDRSLVDNIAYLTHYNQVVNKELLDFNYVKYYHKLVFFAPPWPEIYKRDKQRPQEFKAQISLSKTLKETYKKQGFTVVELPCVNVEKRLAFVLAFIKKLNQDVLAPVLNNVAFLEND